MQPASTSHAQTTQHSLIAQQLLFDAPLDDLDGPCVDCQFLAFDDAVCVAAASGDVVMFHVDTKTVISSVTMAYHC